MNGTAGHIRQRIYSRKHREHAKGRNGALADIENQLPKYPEPTQARILILNQVKNHVTHLLLSGLNPNQSLLHNITTPDEY